MNRTNVGGRKPRADSVRNQERLLAAAKAAFRELGPGVSLEEIARRAEVGIGTLYRHFPTRDALVKAGKPFDVVICNAGVMATPQGKTSDGFETQFGTNHLGHFVFVNRIAKLLKAGSRVVTLSSAGHRYSNVDLDDPNFEHTPYEPWVAYGRAKTANILFAVEFDRRHKADGIRAAAVHPGGIQTELGRHMTPEMTQALVDRVNRQQAAGEAFRWKTIPQGAATSLWAGVAAPAEEVGGHYCVDCRVVTEIVDDPNANFMHGGVRPYALDPDNAKALWAKSEAMVGETF